MDNQKAFLNKMKEIYESLKQGGKEVTKEEVRAYFQGMDMKEEQYEAVYRYLAENGIVLKDFHYGEESGRTDKDRRVLKEYRAGIQDVKPISSADAENLLLAYEAEGLEDTKNAYLNGVLHMIADTAETYLGRGVSAEELLQEGTLGVLEALEDIRMGVAKKPYATFAGEGMRLAMMRAIDGSMHEKDLENTMLAKVNLVHSAAKYMAEENGRMPDRIELAEYTHISVEEITEILRLAHDS